MRIETVEAGHDDAVRRLLEIGLREQEVFAAQCDPPEDDGFFDEELREHLEGLRSSPDEWCVALDAHDRVAGVLWFRVAADRLGRYGSVRQIIVDPAHRRRGIGTRLLRWAEIRAREAGTVMFLISALRPNPAWRLYRAGTHPRVPRRTRPRRTRRPERP